MLQKEQDRKALFGHRGDGILDLLYCSSEAMAKAVLRTTYTQLTDTLSSMVKLRLEAFTRYNPESIPRRTEFTCEAKEPLVHFNGTENWD